MGLCMMVETAMVSQSIGCIRRSEFFIINMRSMCTLNNTLIQKSFYGKAGFIGCSKWVQGKDSNDHRFIGIPKDVKEELIVELFESEDGSFKSKSVETKECARVLHPRHGGRGRRECRK